MFCFMFTVPLHSAKDTCCSENIPCMTGHTLKDPFVAMAKKGLIVYCNYSFLNIVFGFQDAQILYFIYATWMLNGHNTKPDCVANQYD